MKEGDNLNWLETQGETLNFNYIKPTAFGLAINQVLENMDLANKLDPRHSGLDSKSKGITIFPWHDQRNKVMWVWKTC